MTTVRLVQLSDIHFGLEHKAAVAAAADWCRNARPDLTIVAGDITQFGRRNEFEAGKVWFDGLPQPSLITPGNHDVPYSSLPERVAAPFARYRKFFGEPWSAAHDAPGLAVRAVNTARGLQLRMNWSKGVIRASHAEAAAKALGEAPEGALRVLVCHHPLVEAAGAPMSGGVQRGVVAAKLFAQAGVDLILTGHVHTPFAVPAPQGDGRTYGVGSGTLSVRERGAPPGFNLIEADADTITVTAQGWTGSRFEPQRTWALQRRSARAAETLAEAAVASGGGSLAAA